MKILGTFLIALSVAGPALGDGLQVATRSTPRMPPAGIEIPPDIKAELEKGVSDLGWQIQGLMGTLKSRPELLDLLPDVQVYHNAVRYALEDGIFYKTNDFAIARKLLEEGSERARSLNEGKAPWTNATGLIVRGYKSKIDGSVQPYGLVVPTSFQPGANHKHRLDFWFHGRNNNGSELSFISDREKNPGEFTPADTFVLHPYGRYCNAFKFAGETDAFEALADVRQHYPIDENRISVRGFSMGGAATWHLAGHYAGLWAAASPGAGFVDTMIFQKMKNPSAWYQERLWHLYDVTDYAANLFNCPVVAYSGEIDPQRQAAELMRSAMADEGLQLVHIIGPKTAHKFEPKAKQEVCNRFDALMAKGRNPMPNKVRFTTWTLRYNQMDWVTVDELERHWDRARVDAEISGPDTVRVTTTNVDALTFSMPAGLCPLDVAHPLTVTLDGQTVAAPAVAADKSWTAHFQKQYSFWTPGQVYPQAELHKQHGLQGPIDDAFMDSFIMVRPTGKPMNDQIGAWTTAAMADAIREWRLQFRGEARVKDDSAVTETDMAANNLVLWGDPRSNHLLGRIASELPIRWSTAGIRVSGRTYSPQDHIPVMIYPNPLNPSHYMVLNSGFTFVDAAPTSNALQIPRLPDYAVFDLAAGCVADAGFFDEKWRLPGRE
jgi:dienelactone hydrolase